MAWATAVLVLVTAMVHGQALTKLLLCTETLKCILPAANQTLLLIAIFSIATITTLSTPLLPKAAATILPAGAVLIITAIRLPAHSVQALLLTVQVAAAAVLAARAVVQVAQGLHATNIYFPLL